MTLRRQVRMTYLLIMLTLFTFALVTWHSLVMYNLPVCANVDERRGLDILNRFHGGSFDPNWFFYPTLYYYLTYFVTRPFPFHAVLLYGRLLNVGLLMLIALSSYFFCKINFQSRLAGIIAAALTLFSPTLNASATYLDTDVLLALLSLLGVIFWQRFFGNGAVLDWGLGTLFAGLAVACKYPAFLLIAAYFAVEVASPPPAAKPTNTYEMLLQARIPKMVLISCLIGLGIVALCLALFFPTRVALQFIAHNRIDLTLRTGLDYAPFLLAMQLRLFLAGALAIALGVAVGCFPAAYCRVPPLRPFAAAAAAFVILVATSPFCVISWRRCLYDLGAQMKATVVLVGGELQWRHYLHWYFQSESLIAGGLFFVGMALLLRSTRRFILLLSYVTLYLLVIGTNRAGFPRYLTPVLPLIFCIAAYGAVSLFTRMYQTRRTLACSALGALVFLVAVELYPKVHSLRQHTASHDSLYRSYFAIMSLHPTRVYYSGVAPGVELQMAGVDVHEIPRSKTEDLAFLQSVGPQELLVIDRGRNGQLPAVHPSAMKAVFSDPESYGQDVYQPVAAVSTR